MIETDEQNVIKYVKLCLDELNQAYKECNKEAESINADTYTVVMGRDPLLVNNTLIKAYKLSEEEIDIVLKLKFEFDYTVGRKGSWICITPIEVIDLD